MKKNLILGFLLASSSLIGAELSCQHIGTVKKFDGHYYALSAKTMNFEEAYRLSFDTNAYLAVPNTKEENAFISTLVDSGSSAFIGVLDPNFTSNYCYDGQNCSYDDSRFKGVNNEPLTYKNFAEKEPDNRADKDNNLSGQFKGEHFIIIDSSTRKWSDVSSEAKYKAIYEFDTMPSCYNDTSDSDDNTGGLGGSDEEELGGVQGANDANNDGWNEDGSCSGQILIFNGKDNRCKSWDRFGGLSGGGCCDKDKVFLGLVGCSESDRQLAQQNRDRKCVEIGEYCSKKKKFIGCIQRKKTFCCFNSKLARIFHEQGRPQIGMGWGWAEAPQCRGYTPEEFQKLDFSEIDLSEFIADVVNQVDIGSISADSLKIKDKIQNNVNNMKK